MLLYNMHQTSTFVLPRWPLRMLLCLVALLHPVLPHLPADFSHAYAQLIASARVLPPWWATCRNNSRQESNICLQYLAPLPEENITQLQMHSHEAEEEEGQEDEVGWTEVIWVLVQEGWRVAHETGREWLASLLEQQETRTVEYDDNYASLNGGAIVLRKSSQKIHNAQAILQDSSDKYLYSDAALPIEIVVALKEEVKIERISLRSNEVYSSIVKEFVLQGALDLEEEREGGAWFKLLSASARNTGAEQPFRVLNKVVRFLRLRILSKHGDWKYFTMTQLKVYGEGLFTEALIDYQTAHQTMDQPRLGEVELATDLGAAYQQLTSFGSMKKPDQNVLTFLLQKVTTLSKVHQFELFYMQNLSRRLENASRLEREFYQHKNQYNTHNALFAKYRQQKKMEQKLESLEAEINRKLTKQNAYLEQLKLAELTNPQVCPNKEEEFRLLIIYCISTALLASLLLSSLVVYCCLKHYKTNNKQMREATL